MHWLKRSLIILIVLALFSAGLFIYQEHWVSANKSRAEQIAELYEEALKIQKQLSGLQGYIFARDLKLGDGGEDVRQLQKILNSDSATQVAFTGSGSPGNETDYFGFLTQLAVIKFQQKHASEVLNPSNQFSGTGHVSGLTREKLNSFYKSIYLKSNDQEEINETVSTDSQNIMNLGFGDNVFADSDELLVTFVSNYSGPAGSSLTVYGSGFEKENNVVHFGEEEQVSNLKSNGSVITFKVPNIKPGKYDLFVSNSKNGISEIKTFFIVTPSAAVDPKITSITPSVGDYGEEITIHGEGFTFSDNTLMSSYGVISNLESTDGKTLKFKVEPYPDTSNISYLEENKLGVSWPIHFYIVNANGVGKERVIFNLKL